MKYGTLPDDQFGYFISKDNVTGNINIVRHIPPNDDEWPGEEEPYILEMGVDRIPFLARNYTGTHTFLGPITPEMVEEYDPVGRQMSTDLLKELYQTACVIKDATAQLVKQNEAGITITCPTCGSVLESSLNLRYCDCGKPVCTECTGGDIECLVCLECGAVTSEIKGTDNFENSWFRLAKDEIIDIEELARALTSTLTPNQIKRLTNAFGS